MMVLASAESAVVKIQPFGAIWDGVLMFEGFFICDEHLDVMLAAFLSYNAEMQVSGFASGWKGVGMVQNCPFAAWQIWNWWGKSATAMVSSLVILRFLVVMS